MKNLGSAFQRDDMLVTVISVFLIGVLLGAWWIAGGR